MTCDPQKKKKQFIMTKSLSDETNVFYILIWMRILPSCSLKLYIVFFLTTHGLNSQGCLASWSLLCALLAEKRWWQLWWVVSLVCSLFLLIFLVPRFKNVCCYCAVVLFQSREHENCGPQPGYVRAHVESMCHKSYLFY